MRKIEQEMLKAIRNRSNWSMDNTAVFFVDTDGQTRAEVTLHGKHIADFNYQTKEVEVNTRTLRNWPTNTTKSRLRALGLDIATRKGVTYIEGTAI